MKGQVQTVPGPVAPADLGVTITHERVLSIRLPAPPFSETRGG